MGTIKQEGWFVSMIIINGKIVTESDVIEGSLRIDGEKILEIGQFEPEAGEEVLDAAGAYVLPGGIDPHTHMELQQSEKFRSADDFYTGTVAAALGGTTTIIDHIGFGPEGCSLSYSLDQYYEKAKKAVIDYSFHGVIQQVNDEILEELRRLIEKEGIASFKAYSTYGFKIDDESLLKVMRVMKAAGGILAVHCENDAAIKLLKTELRAEGKTDAIFHARSRPSRTEAEYISRVGEFSALSGNAPVYIVHTSTEVGTRRIRTFQQEGIPVFMETCPQYLILTEAEYEKNGNAEGVKYIMAPPLREDHDREALWAAMADGTCQTVGTDHCPFCYAEKLEGLDDFAKAPGGAPGVQERISLLFTEGLLTGRLTLRQFTDLISSNAAKILGLYPRKGVLKKGSDADILILKEGSPRTIRAAAQASVCDYSIYEGRQHRCQIDYVLSRGEIIASGGEFKGERGRGRFQPRFIDGQFLKQHED